MLRNPLRARHLEPGHLRQVQALEIALTGVDRKADRPASLLIGLHDLGPHQLIDVKVHHAAGIGIDPAVGIAERAPGVGQRERHLVQDRHQIRRDLVGNGTESLVLHCLGRLFDENGIAGRFVAAECRRYQQLQGRRADRVALHLPPLAVNGLAVPCGPVSAAEKGRNRRSSGAVEESARLGDLGNGASHGRSPPAGRHSQAGENPAGFRRGGIRRSGHGDRINGRMQPMVGVRRRRKSGGFP